MKIVGRVFLLLVSAVEAVIGIGFIFQWDIFIRLWPFEGTTPLTYTLLASFIIASAASTIWVAVSGAFGALAGIGLDTVTMLSSAAIASFWLGSVNGKANYFLFGIVCVIGVLFGFTLLIWGLLTPLPTHPRMPALVRISFVIFVVALVIAAGLLVLNTPNVIPWKITPELSLLIGLMFLGAAAYFVYGLLRPRWANAGSQLAGFLAYDLVLIVPFLNRLQVIPAEQRISMILYLIVVIYSGLIAFFFLFLDKRTRFWGADKRNDFAAISL